ncbi:MAG: hypothetical protein AAF389_20200 [Gemmatimonadota bacterium]
MHPLNQPPDPPDVWCLLVAGSEPVTEGVAALLSELHVEVVRAVSSGEGLGFLTATHFDLAVVFPDTSAHHDFVAGARSLDRSRPDRMTILAVVSEGAALARSDVWVSVGYDDVALADHHEDLRRLVLDALDRSAEDLLPRRGVRQADGNEDVYRRLLSDFESSVDRRFGEISEAVGRGDGLLVDANAHALEALAHRLAMPQVRDVSHRIAAHGRRGEVLEAADLVDELETRLAGARRAARNVLDVA